VKPRLDVCVFMGHQRIQNPKDFSYYYLTKLSIIARKFACLLSFGQGT